MQRWRSLLTIGMLLLASFGLQAQVRVVLVSSGNSAAFVEAEQAFVKTLEAGGNSRYSVRQIQLAELSSSVAEEMAAADGLFVALGTDASLALARLNPKVPVLSALLPRASFARVLSQSGRRASSQFSALYLDQPLLRQLALIHLALPQARRLSVLWGSDSLQKAPTLRQLATQQGLAIHEAQVSADGQVFAGLKQVLDGSDVFLALADPLVFNATNLQNILLASFRARVPMVAFSPAYVRAGALMALHTTPAQAGAQAGVVVREWLLGSALPATALEPNQFEVTVNQHVARTFDLILDEKNLQQALRRSERLP